MSAWKSLLNAVPVSARDNVISMEPSDPHKPPLAWNTRYREASEQLAYLERIRAELTDFDVRAEAAVAAISHERSQRVAAISEAQRRLDGLHHDIHMMAGNIGIASQEETT